MKPKIKLFKSKIIKDDNQRKKENWYISKIRLNINKKVNASIYKMFNLKIINLNHGFLKKCYY